MNKHYKISDRQKIRTSNKTVSKSHKEVAHESSAANNLPHFHSIESQVNMLQMSNISQCQALIAQIGQVQGNHHTQRLATIMRARKLNKTGPTAKIQRDLLAYNKSKTKSLPSFDPMGGSVSYIELSVEAPGIRKALGGLIATGKIKEVKSAKGDTSWFAAQHHKNAKLDEIKKALQKAGYGQADKLARSIYDIHGEFRYTNQKLTTIAGFYSKTTDLGKKIEMQTHRSMTEWEIGQAKRVFGSAIDYPKVTIAEGSISSKIASAGGYARTIGNTINFPSGGSRDMAFMIHELTHVWQYQTTGVSYAPKAIWAQITEGYKYSEKGKSAAQSLKDARKAGKTLYSYNLEQQGDILSDYYRRLQQGKDTSAWQEFVNDI